MVVFLSCFCVYEFHVKIYTRFDDENSFVNKKRMTFDQCSVYDGCFARWPGSTHDLFSSSAHLTFAITLGTIVQLCKVWFLLTALTNFLMARYDTHATHQQQPTKELVPPWKEAFGQLKPRFNCFAVGFGEQTEKASIFVIACMILHNIATMLDEEDFDGNDDKEFECCPVGAGENSSDGKTKQTALFRATYIFKPIH